MAEGCGKLTWLQRIKILMAVVLPIVSMVLAIIAYAAIAKDVGNISEAAITWDQKPILDVQFAASATSCPTGFESAEHLPWVYTVEKCDCRSVNSTKAGCSNISKRVYNGQCTNVDTGSSQSATGCGCSQQYPEVAQTLQWPVGDRPILCLQRSDASLNAINRKRAKVAGDCSAFVGTRACGNWDCIPTATSCPVTSLRWVAPGAEGFQNSVSPSSNATSGSYVLAFNRSDLSSDSLGALPRLRIRIGELTTSARTGNNANLGGSTPWVDLVAPMLLSDVVAMQPNASAVYERLAKDGKTIGEVAGASHLWGMTASREADWKASCPVSRDTMLNTLLPKIDSVRTAQLASLVITCCVAIFNFFAAWSTYTDWTDDDKSNDNRTLEIKAACNMVSEVINLVPSIIAMVIAFSVKGEFQKVSEAECSNATVNASIDSMTARLAELGGINIVKSALSALYLAYRIASLLRRHFCPNQGDKIARGMMPDLAQAPEYAGPPPEQSPHAADAGSPSQVPMIQVQAGVEMQPSS